MLVDSYKVTAATTDITELVTGMSFFESINGLLKGNIQMLDGTNFFDVVIGEQNRLIPVEIEIVYDGQMILMPFMVDGINQMKIFKNEKSYVMHLVSTEEYNLKLNDINAVYGGSANNIVERIYLQASGERNRLIVNTISITNGKYIVPNIQAIQAIANVTYAAVDSEQSGFYFYQRLYDEGACRFASLYSMSKDFHMVDGTEFKIRNAVISSNELKDAQVDLTGTAKGFELEEYRMYHSDKLYAGDYGHKLHHLELDESKVRKYEALSNSSSHVSTRYKISEKLYDVYTESRGPHGEPVEYQQRSLFHDVNSPNTQAAINLKKRIYNNTINVMGMVPSAGLGAGQSIKLELGSSDVSYSISDGVYIVGNINHSFSRKDDGGGLDYIQNIKLLREYA